MLINSTYFVGDINLPNTDNAAVAEMLNFFIAKYEPELFQKAWGYAFYKAFYDGITALPIAQRWIDLLYGVEYTNSNGVLSKWRGLIETEAPVYSFGSGLQYRQPELLQAGVTPGFTSGVNTVTFDGTDGAPDFRGWEIIPERIGQGTMKKNIDYTWDIVTGEWTLLEYLDTFQDTEYFFIQFVLQQEDATVITYPLQRSLIAYYVYYWYSRNNATQTTGVGEVSTEPAGAKAELSISKQVFAWNAVVDWLYELYDYLNATTGTYPEYDQSIFSNALGGYGWGCGWSYGYPYSYPSNYGYFKKVNQFNI